MTTWTHETLITHIRQHGERITLPRRAVIESLCALGGHHTTQQIQAHLAQQVSLDEATIYRVLQWLKQLGVVAQTDLGQTGITYELVSTPPHHHLICLKCGGMQELDDAVFEPLRQHLRAVYAFEPRIDHMACFGICQTCRALDSQAE